MKRKVLFLLTVLGIAGLACNALAVALPSPTATPTAAPTQAPALPPTPTLPAPQPTDEAAPTQPPAAHTPAGPGGDKPPAEAILIESLGSGSKVASPFTIKGTADPVFESTLQVEVRDEGGSIIGVGIAMIHADIGQRGPFEATVEFTPPAAPQPGRISIFSSSARDGHVTHLASVNVTLLPSGGASDIKPAPEHPEEISIQSPALSEVVSGGTAHIKGVAAPIFEQALRVAIVDASGAIVGSSSVIVQGEAGKPGRFEADVPYAVGSEQPGSIQVYFTSPRDGGIVHLSSVEVTLRP